MLNQLVPNLATWEKAFTVNVTDAAIWGLTWGNMKHIEKPKSVPRLIARETGPPAAAGCTLKQYVTLVWNQPYVNCPLFMGDILQYEVGGSSSSFCSFLWQLFLYLLSPVLCWYYQFLCFSPDIQVKRSARTSSFKALHSNAIWLLGILK